MTTKAVIKECLAAYAHNAWAGWMKYMFEKSTQNSDGSITIPPSLVERWTRQMNTIYGALPESEKQSDLEEADKMLDIVGECFYDPYQPVPVGEGEVTSPFTDE